MGKGMSSLLQFTNFCKIQPFVPIFLEERNARESVNQVFRFCKKRTRGMKYIPKKYRILAVDSDVPTLNIISELLSEENIEIVQAQTLDNAFRILESKEIHLIITDYFLINGSGVDLIKKFRTNKNYPVIMMSTSQDRQVKIDSLQVGANMYIVKPFGIEIKMIVNNLLNLMEVREELENASDMIHALSMAVEKRDTYTQGHHFRVTTYSLAIYDEIYGEGNPEERKALRMGCMLHDLGKIGVPDSILKSKNPLSRKERREVEKHSIYGYEICKDLKTLITALPVIRHHHEKLDGSGYPDKLKGGQISNIVAISTVADIFDALTSNRSYRKKNTSKEALKILSEEAKAGKINSFFVATLEKIIIEEGGVSNFFQIFSKNIKNV